MSDDEREWSVDWQTLGGQWQEIGTARNLNLTPDAAEALAAQVVGAGEVMSTRSWSRQPADPLGDLTRFVDSMRRTVACNPAQADAVRADVERQGLPFVEVVASRNVPEGTLYLFPSKPAEG